MNLKIETRVADGVTIVSCHGRIMFGEEATSLRETLKKVLSSNRHIVLNLAGVTYVDSGGLGTLVGVYSSARAGGADIKLTGLGQRLRDVLQITINLDHRPFSVGRKVDKDLVIADPRVSRDHALITSENGLFYVLDQGSKHGTFVNGERVQRKNLERNDRLEFGVRDVAYVIF